MSLCEMTGAMQHIHKYMVASAQRSFIQKFKLNFCGNICRVHTVWEKYKTYESQNFLKRQFRVSLKKDFMDISYIFY